MESKYLSINEVVLTLGDCETLSQHILASCVNRAKSDPNVWSVYLLIDGLTYSRDRIWIQELGFSVAGNVCKDATTLLKLKCPIRTSGETGTRELAVTPPSLHDTRLLKPAVDGMNLDARFSDSEIEKRLQQIAAESAQPVIEANVKTLSEAALRTQYRREGR